jgi:hypothetical protein
MEGSTTGTALERRAPSSLSIALITDEEIRKLYRVAESLQLSGLFKDVKKAEQAFAKMVIGRDLGMSPAQAMLGLHAAEGGFMVHYAMLGHFIRSRADEGYDFRPGWLKLQPKVNVPNQPDEPEHRVAIWADEEDPVDEREVVGAFVEFTIHGKVVGLSRYTIEDAKTAGLIKSDPRSGWNANRRNLLRARCLSNGVKWYVPEVLGGLPIYVEGELVKDQSVTSAVGDGDAQGLDLGPKVDAIIERAEALGHAYLSDRAMLEVQLGKRAPAVVNQFVKDATAKLDEFEAAQYAADTDGPVDAEVVEEDPRVEVAEDMSVVVLRNRWQQLTEARGEEQDPEKRAQIDEEIDFVENALRDAGAEIHTGDGIEPEGDDAR